MAKVIIIGAGPAGVSAALYTVRAGIETLVLSNGGGALKKAERIENYYGFPQPVSGEELMTRGIEGARRLGVSFQEEEVVGIGFEDSLVVSTTAGRHAADAVLLATGTSRLAPPIPGLKDFEGRGVSYCAVCDAFFYRGRDVAVLGSGEYALHEARELEAVARSVTILTNGQTPSAAFPEHFRMVTGEIAAVEGGGMLGGVRLKDGTLVQADGLFVAVGVAGSVALAKKIGALTEGTAISVDQNMATNVPGLYAAGDCTGGLLQISKAVYEGAKAGIAMVKALRK